MLHNIHVQNVRNKLDIFFCHDFIGQSLISDGDNWTKGHYWIKSSCGKIRSNLIRIRHEHVQTWNSSLHLIKLFICKPEEAVFKFKLSSPREKPQQMQKDTHSAHTHM